MTTISRIRVAASDYAGYAVKRVVSYEIVEERHVGFITKYEDCGEPYRVKIVTYKTVKVPVVKYVRACY